MIVVHGKMILAGEHSVVYGHSAVAAPVTPAVTLTETDSGHFVAPSLGLDLPMDADHPMLVTLRTVLPWERRPAGAGLELGGQLPPGLGMGFSAALSAALARQFCTWTRIQPQRLESQVRTWAHELENLFHGGASGLDVEAVLVHHALEFRRGHPVTPIDVSGAFHIVGAAFPVTASTKQCVAQVRTARDSDPEAARRIDSMGELAQAAARVLREGQEQMLGNVFNAIQEHLDFFGLNTDATRAAIQLARQCGAYGAKISGAGGGGLVIAVAPAVARAAIEKQWASLSPVLQFRHTLS